MPNAQAYSVSDGFYPLETLTVTQTISLTAINPAGGAVTRAKVWFAGNGTDAYLVRSAYIQQGSVTIPVTVNGAGEFYVPAYGRWSDYFSTSALTLPASVSFCSAVSLSVPLLIPIIGGTSDEGTVLGVVNEDLSGIGDILWKQSCLSDVNSHPLHHFVVCNKKAYIVEDVNNTFDTWLKVYNIVTKEWDNLSQYPGYSMHGHAIVAVGNIIYVGMGPTYNSLIEDGYPREWYKYDTVTNQWTQLADFAREPVGINGLQGMACEHVSGKIYVGLGAGNQSGGSENYWYAYDIAANSWATMAVCPVTNYGNSYDGERYPFHGVIDDKIYVGGGAANKSPYSILKTWLCYDPATDSWTTIGNVPFDSMRGDCVTLNGEIYCATNKRLYVFDGAGWKEAIDSICGYLSVTEVTSTAKIWVVDNDKIAAGNTITITAGDVATTYTFVNIPTGAQNEIAIGLNRELTAANISAAINDTYGAVYKASSMVGNKLLVLNFEGADGAVSWTEEAQGLTPIAQDTPLEIDTAVHKFGTSSLHYNGLRTSNADLNYELPEPLAGDFTFSLFINIEGLAGYLANGGNFFDLLELSGSGDAYALIGIGVTYDVNPPYPDIISLYESITDRDNINLRDDYANQSPFIENTQHHFAVISHGKKLMYAVDGKIISSYACTSDYPMSGCDNIHISGPGSDDGINPSLVIHWDGIELVDYAKWTNNFTVPATAPNADDDNVIDITAYTEKTVVISTNSDGLLIGDVTKNIIYDPSMVSLSLPAFTGYSFSTEHGALGDVYHLSTIPKITGDSTCSMPDFNIGSAFLPAFHNIADSYVPSCTVSSTDADKIAFNALWKQLHGVACGTYCNLWK